MSKIEDFKDRHVCVLGLGYVGLTLAVTMADLGFNVMGIEIRPEICEILRKGEVPFHEPGLRQKFQRVTKSGKFKFSDCIGRNLSVKVYIITVGTPLGIDGVSRLDMIESVTNDVSKQIQNEDIVILRSTVKVGTTRNVVKTILDNTGKKYDLAFCPERTLEGQALTELRRLPQIVGGVTSNSTVRASEIFQFITPTIVQVSDLETAEFIKLVDNTSRDVKFAFANEIAMACDVIGVKATEVIEAGKLGYPRTNLALPGPVGGPCLEKDSYILAESLKTFGFTPQITLAARKLNEIQPKIVVRYLRNLFDKKKLEITNPKIALLGVAFKGNPPTDDLRGTMARPIFENLQTYFPEAEFYGFDFVVKPEEIRNFGLRPVTDLTLAFESSNIVLILNNHKNFSTMDLDLLSSEMAEEGIIYDFWNFFKATDLRLSQNVDYIALGSHTQILEKFGFK